MAHSWLQGLLLHSFTSERDKVPRLPLRAESLVPSRVGHDLSPTSVGHDLPRVNTHTEAEATTCTARDLLEVSLRERGSHSSPSRLGDLASPHSCHCLLQATPTLGLLLFCSLPRTGISKLPAHHLCLQIKFYWHTATLIVHGCLCTIMAELRRHNQDVAGKA